MRLGQIECGGKEVNRLLMDFNEQGVEETEDLCRN